MRPAVFLDRDGTIIEDVPYLSRPDEVALIPGASHLIRRLNEYNIPVILVSNQSGVARGYVTPAALSRVQDRLMRLLRGEGSWIDATYLCVHHPDDRCTCRKPSPRMLIQASRELDIDLSLSCMIGDKASDIEAGKSAGCRTVLVMTGNGRSTAAELSASGRLPDHITGDLSSLWPWLFANVVCRCFQPSRSGRSPNPRHDVRGAAALELRDENNTSLPRARF